MTSHTGAILGIETSCDETAAAVVVGGRKVLSSVIATQNDLHAKFRGIVPEIASRAHLERMNLIIDEAMQQAGMKLTDVDAIAAVNRPGLVGSLLVGFTTAKSLAWALKKPLIAVNHVHAHAYGAMIDCDPYPVPAVALIVSGGHTSLFHCRSVLQIEQIGKTQDDAAGEAFDKVATVLDLPYPGGPAIDALAKNGNDKAIRFPRTYLKGQTLNFSFSGIKTAILYHVRGNRLTRPDSSHLSDKERADVAASFQAAVVDVLVDKSIDACRRVNVQTVLLGGGVAANSYLRNRLQQRCDAENIRLHMADWAYCTDNAAMVAGLGWHLHEAGEVAELDEVVTSAAK